MAIGIKHCAVCSTSFLGTAKAVYCSQKCKQSAYRFRRKLNFEVGETYKSRNHGEFKVITIWSTTSVVEFLKTGVQVELPNQAVISRNIVDPTVPVVCGVGFLGIGDYNTTAHREIYNCWVGMITRCYSEGKHGMFKTYADCSVCDDWHNFQNYAEWYCNNHPQDGNDYEVDKDSKVKGNKIYSPDTCVFLTKFENVREANARRIQKTN